MTSTFLYFADERLTCAELAGARLDGDLVEVGEAYMPADAVETPHLRAAALHGSIPAGVAVTRQTAAWLHGATACAPARHTVQRRVAVRPHHVMDPRLDYRDPLIEARDVMPLGELWVTSPARTLADLVRALCAGDGVDETVHSLLGWQPGLAAAAIDVLEQGRPVHYKRPALAFLREHADDDAGQLTRT